MTEQTALTLPQRAALALDSSKTETHLRELVASTADMVEVLNKAARDQIHSAAMTYRDHRVAIEKTGKASRDDATKFSKAVIAEEGRLIEIISAEEKRLLALRDAYDEKIEAEKQAKLAAERKRVEGIQVRIDEFAKLALQAAGLGSRGIDALQQTLIALFETLTEEFFEEFLDKAKAAYASAESSLEVSCKAAMDAEAVAEAARLKREEEDLQRAAEAARLEAQRKEQERIAAEQEAEQKRIREAAAAHAAEIERKEREARARMQAEADAEIARVNAAAAAHAAEMKRQADQLAEERAKFEAMQAATQKAEAARVKAIDDAARLESDHAEALLMDAEWTALKSLEEEAAVAEASAKVDPATIADALIAESMDILEAEPTDDEIIAVYIEAFGGTRQQAIDRLQKLFI